MQDSGEFIRVCVCHALPGRVWMREVTLPAGAPAARAVPDSGYAREFPGADAWKQGVGVYGKRVAPDTPLAGGDRVEIYRPLSFDPKESRRRRAERRRAARQAALGRARPPGLL
jgi:putative ubiquitin-RnfH superfamily antitoxin RatB of RatAB toxin-antitoxin module